MRRRPIGRPAVIVAFLLLASACGAMRDGSGEGGWEALPESPLSPRHGAHAFWVGERVIVLGGSSSDPCPPNADCIPPMEPYLRDGAEFDPASRRWRPIADAPEPLGWLSGAVLGDTLYLWIPKYEWMPGSRTSFIAYHAGEDRWERLPEPPGGEDGFLLTAADDRLVAYQGSQERGVRSDLVYDPGARAWTDLPPDPLIPSFDRSMVWTDAGLVLLGIEDVPQPGSDGPAVYRAAVLDPGSGTWHRLPDSEVSGYDPSWFWAGGKVVNPTLGTSDGGGNDWGRAYPHGGILDPAEGLWSPLPDPPASDGFYPGVSVGGEEFVASLMGWVLHVPSGGWTRLPPPPDAAHEGHAVTWAGDRLFAWGGVRWDGDDFTLLADGWSWSPPTPGSARVRARSEVFFPTWTGEDRPQAIVTGLLTERDGCLFLRANGQEVLALWERGYSYAGGVLLDPSARPVVRVGELLHGGGGYGSSWQHAEDLVGGRIPPRCRPEGVEPFALIYDVEPGPFIDRSDRS
jgi:hypothetical protein